MILAVTSALTGLALLFVVGRIYSRIISVGKLAVDDFIVIFCIVSPPAPPRLILTSLLTELCSVCQSHTSVLLAPLSRMAVVDT